KAHAHTLVDHVSQEEKEARVEQGMETQQGISYEINQTNIGQAFKVVVDRLDGDYFSGRTACDSPEVDNEVILDAKTDYVRIGDFVKVEVERAEDFDLYGKVIK